jgi:hypothetical protein
MFRSKNPKKNTEKNIRTTINHVRQFSASVLKWKMSEKDKSCRFYSRFYLSDD